MRYDVVVSAYGIGISAELTTADGKTVSVVSDHKVKAEGSVVSQSFVCEKAGMLTVTFDNTYSVLRSKTFKFKLSVEAVVPEEAVHGDPGQGLKESKSKECEQVSALSSNLAALEVTEEADLDGSDEVVDDDPESEGERID